MSHKKKNSKNKKQTQDAVVNISQMELGNSSLKEVLKNMTPEALFIDRELSWLEFNRRVLEEAADESNPLLERVKYLAIFATNLDEFVMIRVSGLLAKVMSHTEDPVLGGLTARQELEAIQVILAPMQKQQTELWEEVLKPRLREHNMTFVGYEEGSKEMRAALDLYFDEEVFPLLTPLLVDPMHPFPFVSNLSLNLAVTLSQPKSRRLSVNYTAGSGDEMEDTHFARIKIPSNLKRFVDVSKVLKKYGPEMPPSPRLQESPSLAANPPLPEYAWVLLEEVIMGNLHKLFPGLYVKEAHLFRVIRDADFEIVEDEAGDLLSTMEQATHERRFGNVVQLIVKPDCPDAIESLLCRAFDIKPSLQLFKVPFFGFNDLWGIYGVPSDPELKYRSFVPRLPRELRDTDGSLWSVLKEQDLLLCHPYDSFATTTDFFASAARDPRVLAIKATLYRVGSNSPIVRSLLDAVRNEKEVTVLVELKARFDEKNNIVWAKQLEAEGVHVIYGVRGLKTHAKLGLVIRRESKKLVRYSHMSTGNYNSMTSKFYTDCALMTARADVGADMSALFNRLTGLAPGAVYKTLAIAPCFLRPKLYKLIDREIQHARDGKEASITLKCNSLTDGQMIVKLYEASSEGVKIRLIIRGICCLRPGIPNVSENIEVRSIVGRFLEHSRIYWFHNKGSPECFLSSADLMGRNLDRRVENCFQVYEAHHLEWIWEYVLESQWRDNIKSRVLSRSGTWVPARPAENQEEWDHQAMSIELLVEKKMDYKRREGRKAQKGAKRLERQKKDLDALLKAAAHRGKGDDGD